MLAIPGNLARSTLGDILGSLHREAASGSLGLTDWNAGLQQHAIHWNGGLIHGVESEFAVTSLSSLMERERLVARTTSSVGHAACTDRSSFRRELESARRAQRIERLEKLFGLRQARLTFNVAQGATRVRVSLPLQPMDFLHGRPRLRDDERVPGTNQPFVYGAQDCTLSQRDADLTTLGLPLEAKAEDVRCQFRQLARRWHPDRHPHVSNATLAALSRRFSRLSAAYQRLTLGASDTRAAGG